MDKLIAIILSAYLVLLYPKTLVQGGATKITSCVQTPYPEICNYYIGSNNLLATQSQLKDQTLFNLRDLSLLVTLNQAIQAHKKISSMDLTLFGSKAKLAWSDCLELYESTIDHLNHSSKSANPSDVQTWLSASIANHQTCKNGFLDSNLASHLDHFPSMLISNFSKLISNSLAINKGAITTEKQGGGGGNRKLLGEASAAGGFPSWVSAGDRRLLQTSAGAGADAVVAQDGTGNYKTITEAIAAASKAGGKRFVIHVTKGVYKENVEIKKTIKNIMLIGDGADATIVTGSKSAQETTTFRSATFAVMGSGFIAKDITFENTAGPQNHQAVALRSGSDFSVFYGCSIKGYQDTLYVYAMRQFYKNCNIYGTVDFIFGDAVVVFQSCNIIIRKPMSGQKNTVTAQSRTDPNENTGIVVHNSIVTASSDLKPSQGSFKSYLGRPWQKYSRTVFMKTTIDGVIDSAGWLPWSGSFGLTTLYYAEYMNTGSGASTSGRVTWPGYHVLKSPADASKFTVGNFLAGDAWIPATGVPFDAGL